ncbi:hypothetical protein GCM10011378_06640 [Hymenobacter glacieicola]|uniref:VCBS repeat-containing protein n=1 Tax=Hymenobacter glacieicola TaxID=1562124 RepID=A0ABQ1WJI9_9BACT|nr:hypothetical protein GCM10011378_06640 [Hymenobacter glacieicola]
MKKGRRIGWVLTFAVVWFLLSHSVMAQSLRIGRLAAVPALTPRVVVAHIPNSIDSLRTNADVEQWVRKHALLRKRSYFYPDFQLDTALVTYYADCQHYCAELRVKPWTVVDLDGNGRTDLVAFRLSKASGRFSHEPYIFYDYGPYGDIRTEYLQGRGGGGPCELVAIRQVAGRPALVFAHHVTRPQSDGFSAQPVLQLDTLPWCIGSET